MSENAPSSVDSARVTGLAARLVACQHFRWMPGMLCCSFLGRARITRGWSRPPADVAPLPDPDDPATLGCLLALVREVHHNPALSTCAGRGPAGELEWEVEGIDPRDGTAGAHYPTEAEALTAALESAP